MFDLKEQIPAYLTLKRNIVRLILLTAAFALVFINIYAPFGVESWFNVTRWQLFAYSSLIILTGVLVVVISRVWMYYYAKKHCISYWLYFAWIFAEVASMALFYSLFELLFLKDSRFLPDLLKISLQNTALVLLLPYSVLWLYFSWEEKNERLAEIAQSGQPQADNSKNMFTFLDEKGVLRFSLKLENLLYLEASDNYVNIYYLNKEKISRFLLRNTLKRLEETFKGSEIIRCHRSYMVNCEKVKIIRKDKDGLKLELDVPSANDLPVSKTYIENVMNSFSRFSNNE
jgi:hypothetical protein